MSSADTFSGISDGRLPQPCQRYSNVPGQTGVDPGQLDERTHRERSCCVLVSTGQNRAHIVQKFFFTIPQVPIPLRISFIQQLGPKVWSTRSINTDSPSLTIVKKHETLRTLSTTLQIHGRPLRPNGEKHVQRSQSVPCQRPPSFIFYCFVNETTNKNKQRFKQFKTKVTFF